MMRTLAAWLAMILLLSAGCETKPQHVSQGTVPLKLTSEKKVSEFTMSDEHLLLLTLPPTDAGHHWEISFHDPRYLALKSEIRAAADGAGGPTVSFLALTPGRTRLRFVLVPSTAGRALDPIDQQELILTIE